MKFIISFGAKNIFSFDAKPVTNLDWLLQLIGANEPISEIDQRFAFDNPNGTHAYGTMQRVKQMPEMEGANVLFA